jgi:hypothetical protein
MPSTYSLISSNVLSSSAASVTFSAIPSTYTDLVLRISSRSDSTIDASTIRLRFNGSSSASYSETLISGKPYVVVSTRGASATYMFNAGYFVDDGNGATANTFGSTEVYIPSYTASQNKPISGISAQENNALAARITGEAGLWSNTAAITSIEIFSNYNFLSTSSFYLYGIKNS